MAKAPVDRKNLDDGAPGANVVLTSNSVSGTDALVLDSPLTDCRDNPRILLPFRVYQVIAQRNTFTAVGRRWLRHVVTAVSAANTSRTTLPNPLRWLSVR